MIELLSLVVATIALAITVFLEWPRLSERWKAVNEALKQERQREQNEYPIKRKGPGHIVIVSIGFFKTLIALIVGPLIPAILLTMMIGHLTSEGVGTFIFLFSSVVGIIFSIKWLRYKSWNFLLFYILAGPLGFIILSVIFYA